MKKERVRIEIDMETGEASVDILNALGPSCAKDAEEWANTIGSAKNVKKKAEFFQKSAEKAKNVQTQG